MPPCVCRVTSCHKEEPWNANDGWSIADGQLLNTRSKLCASESQQSDATATVFNKQAKRHTVLGPCSSAQHWSIDEGTGLVKNHELGGCLTVMSGPPPGPGNEPAPPFQLPLPPATTVKSSLALGERVPSPYNTLVYMAHMHTKCTYMYWGGFVAKLKK